MLLIVVMAVLFLLSFLHFHADYSRSDSYSPKQLELLKNSAHLQSMVDETHKLLKEVLRSNITLSRDALRELKLLDVDSNFVRSDLQELTKQLDRLEDGFARCTKERYEANTQLEVCHLHESKLREQLQRSGHISSHPPATPTLHAPDVTNAAVSAAAAAAAAIGTASVAGDKWLVIGIPTVARQHEERYLLQSLQTLATQLPTDPSNLLYHKVLIHVVNLQANADPRRQHRVFYEARDAYSNPANPLSAYFQFSEITADEILPDPKPSANAQNDPGNANKPGFLVRRQTRNIVTVMRRNFHRGSYYLFLEDDMEFCPNGLLAISYLLNKADRYHPQWLAIRASYGMNGIFMRDRDLQVFADYLLKHQARRPPDHLVVEWYAGETAESKEHKKNRANIGFKYNIFNHIGTVSTLRSQKQKGFPGCYELLLVPTVFEVEAYNPRQCKTDDLWPCNVPNADKHTIKWERQ